MIGPAGLTVHCQDVGEFVADPFNATEVPSQASPESGKDGTGKSAPPGTVSVISSTAKDGSVPTPSSLFTQRKPIFTFGLLLALAGSGTVNAVHNP